MKEFAHKIHATLAHSYIAYFLASLFGLFIDMITSVTVPILHSTLLALICYALGPILIIWAQYTSRHSHTESGSLYFNKGPYKFLRNPTHLGLLILVTGYALVSSSVVFFAITLIGYLVSNFFFRKYEQLLEGEHGEKYQNYKSSVNKIL